MSQYISSPAKISSRLPAGVRYARIPNLAQVAINTALSKRAGVLMYYYMGEQDGFTPSAREIEMYTGLAKPNMITARKELIEKGFIEFDREKNTITILWSHIIEVGKVALMLAENKECKVKETMQGGEFFFGDEKKIGQLMRESRDPDAKPYIPTPIHEDYINSGMKELERLTEDEFRLWLQTGCPYPSDLPVDENYVENPELPHVEYPAAEEVDLKWFDLPEKDMSEVYNIEGDFLIQGFTKEEYEAWHDAGMLWPGEEQ